MERPWQQMFFHMPTAHPTAHGPLSLLQHHQLGGFDNKILNIIIVKSVKAEIEHISHIDGIKYICMCRFLYFFNPVLKIGNPNIINLHKHNLYS